MSETRSRRRMCLDKARYRDHDEAALHRRGFEAVRGVALRIYECPICRGFHLSKSNVSKERRIRG